MSGQPAPLRCAVIGSPIAHSLSPLLHRRAYQALGIADRFCYDAFDVDEAGLDGFVAGLDESWVGLSVTAPDKAALLRHGQPDQIAALLQSANTLILGHDGLPNRVFNTDVTGFVQALAYRGVTRANTAIIVGAGATARSAVAALARLGVDDVVVCARDAGRAHDSLDAIAALLGMTLDVQPIDVAPKLPWDGADLLVTTVPANLDVWLARELVGLAEVVFEVVYNFYPSNIDLAAGQAGRVGLDGMHLLVFQALEQIKLMTGFDVDAELLLRAGYEALAQR